MRLLSVDADFFFCPPPGLDWLSAEGTYGAIAYFVDKVWHERGAQLRSAGQPLPVTTGQEAGFWDRFRFTRGARLWYADSHRWGACQYFWDSMRQRSTVWSYDAHHDLGYRFAEEEESWHCANWLARYAMRGVRTHVRYPEWRRQRVEKMLPPYFGRFNKRLDIQIDAPGNRPDAAFDTVLLVRSGSWLPAWCDSTFWQLLESCPVTNREELEPVEPRAYPLPSRRTSGASASRRPGPASADAAGPGG